MPLLPRWRIFHWYGRRKPLGKLVLLPLLLALLMANTMALGLVLLLIGPIGICTMVAESTLRKAKGGLSRRMSRSGSIGKVLLAPLFLVVAGAFYLVLAVDMVLSAIDALDFARKVTR